MSAILRYVRDVYSPDTLDARFAVSSDKSAPLESASDGRVEQKVMDPESADRAPGSQPAKWNTTEFYFYGVALVILPIIMTKAVVDISRESHSNFHTFSHLLSPGWIFGRKVDNSDSQYASFRDNIPYMTLVVIAHPLLRRLHDYWRQGPSQTRSSSGQEPHVTADARLHQRVSFDVAFAFLFLFVLHGVSTFKVFLILYMNYKIATRLPLTYVPLASWTFCIGVLFSNELNQGYPLAGIARLLLLRSANSVNEKASSDWFQWIDSFGGLVPRWEILFNITVLRLLSFNLDYYWTLDKGVSSQIEKKQLDPAHLSERDRISLGAKASDCTFGNYLAYVLYSPLYLAGPIITFNDYISQCRHPLQSVSRPRIIKYGIRFLVVVLTMELVLHFIYAVAICKAQPTWRIYTPLQVSMLGYFNLHIIWLKLLIPWRFFRLWSLMDGVDPPENMVRCMSDNYSALAFWRGWHRSFNRWILRYIYIPLGGSGQGPTRAVLNFLAVFTFVALWHDINLRLLMWGWMVVLFVLPEVLAILVFPAKNWSSRPEGFRMLCGVGAVCNIFMMMAANLVGFAIGVDGLKGLLDGMLGSWHGLGFLVISCGALFIGAQFMFEVRESEKRKGMRLKC